MSARGGAAHRPNLKRIRKQPSAFEPCWRAMDPTRVNGLEHASIVTPEQERRGRRSASPAFDRPLWSSEEFETPTHETAPFRVVLSDDGLPLDRLVRFGGMFFARLRGTHGVHGAHKFPGEWVIVEEGALSGVSRAHFETARMKEGLHHPIVSLGFGSQDVSAVASGAGPAAGLGDSCPFHRMNWTFHPGRKE